MLIKTHLAQFHGPKMTKELKMFLCRCVMKTMERNGKRTEALILGQF